MSIKLRLNTATATKAVLAKIGNPQREEPLQTSKEVFEIAEKDQETLTALFVKPFKNLIGHRFTHHASLDQHEMNICAKAIFAGEANLLERGIEIAKRLYAKSNHPNIKAGDLCIALLKEIHIEGELVNGLCILKSDSVTPFLTITARNGDLRLSTEQGINPDKIDKGCLILDYWSEKGYYILTFDRGGADTRFWVREFLGVEAVPDAAFLTNAYAKMAVSFLEEKKPAEEESRPVLPLPGLLAQATHLMKRRWTLMRRVRREWITHLGLLIGAPVIVWLLVQPNLKHFKQGAEVWAAAYTTSMVYFVMVLLILFMSLRLSSREFAATKSIIGRERVAGVRPGAALLAALLFVLPISLLQSFWMGMFMELVTSGLPGHGGARLMLPALTGIAFGSLCLGISANASNAGRAHSACLTLLCVNVIFSGALLGFPRMLGHLVHPFITAHYGWSGIIDTMKQDAVFPAITTFVRTWFATPDIAAGMLVLHFLIGLILAWIGLRRREA